LTEFAADTTADLREKRVAETFIWPGETVISDLCHNVPYKIEDTYRLRRVGSDEVVESFPIEELYTTLLPYLPNIC